MAKKKPGRQWTLAPSKRYKPKVPEDIKVELNAKAKELIEKVLTPKYINSPPKKPRWNYPIELWTKWHQSFFYFGSTWASPGPNRIAPTFEVRFARLEYVRDRKFNLAYMRHSEEWWTIYKGLTLDKCLEYIAEDGPFSLPVG
ncbi:MAG: hypothetical protein ABSG67_22560 [Thermoguttaceae bacterium]|jgi:hypothetical protein